jgi:CrcB protein
VAELISIVGIALAGSLGALSRYLLGRFIAERVGAEFPFGTLLINVTGAFVIGLLFALTARKLLSPAWQTVLATGFLGGYTTFSTRSWEGVQLARGGSSRLSLLYFGGNLLSGLLATALGLTLGRWL